MARAAPCSSAYYAVKRKGGRARPFHSGSGSREADEIVHVREHTRGRRKSGGSVPGFKAGGRADKHSRSSSKQVLKQGGGPAGNVGDISARSDYIGPPSTPQWAQDNTTAAETTNMPPIAHSSIYPGDRGGD
jgi:hypothetical protein